MEIPHTASFHKYKKYKNKYYNLVKKSQLRAGDDDCEDSDKLDPQKVREE